MDFKTACQSQPPHPQLSSSRSKSTTPICYPATIFNRTPTRERHVFLHASARTLTPVSGKSCRQNQIRVLSPSSETPCFQEGIDNSRKENKNVMNTIGCVNHGNKQGVYEMKEDSSVRYCEKCAILLASQGFKVSKVSQVKPLMDRNQRVAIRRKELETMYELTQQTTRILTCKQSQLTSIQQHSHQQLQSQISSLDHYFLILHNLLDKIHCTLRDFTLSQHHSSHSITSQLQTLIHQQLHQVQKISTQLLQNQPQHLKLAEQKYTPLIESFKLKMSSYRNSVKSWDGVLVPREIQFPEVEEVGAVLMEMMVRGVDKDNRAINKCETPKMTSSKKIKGKSVRFSFERSIAESVIPEEHLDSSGNDGNILDEFVK